ncbi:hypothetical protein F0342_06890 [Bacillus sp. CH30_1T]|uniref:hypothetical protein n=1 Tax=Bacillus sp. CH30_1T TaxID=2604836 RepID=UPI0011EEC7B8|nr:hypothetical protein [Bacillus sp. CH30_1T]KAA0565328.1 hypothetical protein F0342_06890 [Bacillus sp. CH30_1T]
MIAAELIENTNKVFFECELKRILMDIKPKNLIDIKYTVTGNPVIDKVIPDPIHYSALVVYNE